MVLVAYVLAVLAAGSFAGCQRTSEQACVAES